ncbi:MAG: HDOD domain-containing protein [Desulfuromusa sp.]|jgi:HD-like signal output (HDOD) protein|nr:HDOD domain-containing protein [Desulfuromusa sp.]
MAFIFGKKKKTTTNLAEFDIPSFSSAVVSLLGKLRDPEISIDELATELERDPGLHIRVLKTVNSSAFGLSRQVSNIKHAVNLMGRGRLESLVLSVAVKNNLAMNKQAAWFDMAQFWKTASRQAAVARILETTLHPSTQSDVFTIGLLQNIAIPILANREGDRYRTLYQRWQTEKINLAEQELQLFGIDHATLGAQMAEHWGFPEALIMGIGEHHEAENQDIPVSVKIAALMEGNLEKDSAADLAQAAAQLFNLDHKTLLPLIEQALQQSAELSEALN